MQPRICNYLSVPLFEKLIPFFCTIEIHYSSRGTHINARILSLFANCTLDISSRLIYIQFINAWLNRSIRRARSSQRKTLILTILCIQCLWPSYWLILFRYQNSHSFSINFSKIWLISLARSDRHYVKWESPSKNLTVSLQYRHEVTTLGQSVECVSLSEVKRWQR